MTYDEIMLNTQKIPEKEEDSRHCPTFIKLVKHLRLTGKDASDPHVRGENLDCWYTKKWRMVINFWLIYPL